MLSMRVRKPRLPDIPNRQMAVTMSALNVLSVMVVKSVLRVLVANKSTSKVLRSGSPVGIVVVPAPARDVEVLVIRPL